MTRVYIDSNVFRFLKKAETEFYRNLDRDLKRYSDVLLYYFSHAHLLDLKRDKSKKAEEDLEFMEEYVNSNYLSLGWKEEFVNVQVATPKRAFDGIEDDKPLIDYLNLDDIFGDEVLGDNPDVLKANFKLQNLMNLPIRLDLATNLQNFSEEERKLWENLIPDIKDVYTFREWVHQFSLMYDNLFNNPMTYKMLRRTSIEKLSLAQKYNIDIEKIDFDGDLRNTPLEKSFTEFVNKTLKHNKNSIHKEYDFFISAFQCLNILGIDKESNKKAKFANTLSDAQHAYYGAHCDVIVSDDTGFLLKSRVLFKLLDINTKVLHVEEFASQLGNLAGISSTSLNGYLKLLQFDLNTGIIIDKKPSFRYQRTYTTIKPSQPHFGYFNVFDIIKDEEVGTIVVFYRDVKNYSRFVSFKEIEGVTNKIAEYFGYDDNLRKFYSEVDTKEIKNGDWMGRDWTIDPIKFRLEINPGTKQFSLSIIFP